jgi:hypothetical protein
MKNRGFKRHIIRERKDDDMKKITLLLIVVLLTVFASVVMADENGEGKAGRLFLFQKCDESLIGTSGHDSFGCPNIGTGPWPIFPDNQRWGRLNYSLWGKKFAFSFEGRRLLSKTNYTLIYYADPWPGTGTGTNMICLGSGTTNKAGNIAIHGKMDIGTSLPASWDANFNPISPSGAVGAKIWLVLSDDVKCGDPGMMLNWNPTAYLFEYNLIVYENVDINFGGNEED